MKDSKVDLINRSKRYDRQPQIRPRATIFRDKSRWYRPAARKEFAREIDEAELYEEYDR